MEIQDGRARKKRTSGLVADVTDSPKIAKQQYECNKCDIVLNNPNALVKHSRVFQRHSACKAAELVPLASDGNQGHVKADAPIPKSVLDGLAFPIKLEAQENILKDAIPCTEDIKQESEIEFAPEDAMCTSNALVPDALMANSCLISADKTSFKHSSILQPDSSQQQLDGKMYPKVDAGSLQSPTDRCGAAFHNGNNINMLAARIDSLEKTVIMQTKAFNEMKVVFEKVMRQLGEGYREFAAIDTSDALNTEHYTFQSLQTAADLTSLEEKLNDPKFKAWLLRHLEPICGRGGRSDGKNCAYRLVDHIFSRQLLANCSLLGGTKRNNGQHVTNCGIKQHKKVYELFLEVIRKADCTFTMQSQDEFFEVILKNKKARLAAVAKCKAAAFKATKRKKRPKNLLYKRKAFGALEETNSTSTSLHELSPPILSHRNNDDTGSPIKYEREDKK